ncbi:type II secretion system protein [Thermoleophilia bacterium SCSIO 60948]|nr:type II secretion system protein [Thermoleophilia bacterium SCSIO 60948]
MLNKLRERAQGESGFTLIELLVVMLIIGLLAAIAIPSFFNQRDKANDADAKEQVRTAQTAMETYATDNNGSYTGATKAKLVAIEPSLSDAGTRFSEPTVTDADTYEVTVEAETTATDFSIKNDAGTLTYTCTPAGGGCPTGGDWG